jgi:NNP family nitrate/nitrite transporter-like MFS transporter
VADFPWFVALMLGLFLFSGIGNASTFRQMPIIFAESPRRAAGVLGFTAAVAAYGPFAFAALLGWVITSFGSPKYFFYGVAIFYAINCSLNWWFYRRRGAEVPC